MRHLTTLLALFTNLVRGMIRSSWQTARLILLHPKQCRSGLVWLDYGGLGEGAASLLAALITLTPGTTTVAIDTQRRCLQLHLLDLGQTEVTLEEIQRELIDPLNRLCGD